MSACTDCVRQSFVPAFKRIQRSAKMIFKYISLLEEIIKKEHDRDVQNMQARESIKNIIEQG